MAELQPGWQWKAFAAAGHAMPCGGGDQRKPAQRVAARRLAPEACNEQPDRWPNRMKVRNV